MFCPLINYEKKIAKLLIERKMTVSTAESCTGGLISSMLTDVSGSSAFVLSNIVTYSNEAKIKYLNVDRATLDNYGAVSEKTAKEMALGLLKQNNIDVAISITGISGPTGGSKEKPVGMAYVGLCNEKKIVVKKILFPKFLPRTIMKYCFAKKTLSLLCEFIERNDNGI